MCIDIQICLMSSHQQDTVLVPVCDWKRWIRQGVEGRTQEREEAIRHEGDGQGQNHLQEKCQLCHE